LSKLPYVEAKETERGQLDRASIYCFAAAKEIDHIE